MSIRIVTDGKDPLTKPVLDYLAAKYGMAPDDVLDLVLHCPVHDVQTVQVTLTVDPKVILDR
jgi:hypothetical protein